MTFNLWNAKIFIFLQVSSLSWINMDHKFVLYSTFWVGYHISCGTKIWFHSNTSELYKMHQMTQFQSYFWAMFSQHSPLSFWGPLQTSRHKDVKGLCEVLLWEPSWPAPVQSIPELRSWYMQWETEREQAIEDRNGMRERENERARESGRENKGTRKRGRERTYMQLVIIPH